MKATLIAVSLGLLAVGLLAPRTAVRSAHALVAVVAITVLLLLVEPAISAWELAMARPFVPNNDASERPVAPAVIVELAGDLNRSDGVVSSRVRNRIASVAIGRVADHHPSGSSSAARDDLHEYVSPTLLAVIAGGEQAPPIGRRELKAILTELEQL